MEKYLGNRVKINEIMSAEEIERKDETLEKNIGLEIVSNVEGVDLGQTFTYTIIAYNNSDNDLIDVKITQKLEQELRLADIVIDSINIINVDKYNKFIVIYIGNIKAKERKVIDVVVEVINTDNDKFESVAKLEGKYGIDEGTGKNIVVKSNNCSVKVVKHNLVLIRKSSVLEAIVGDDVTCTIIAENKGDLYIDNVVIRDILKPELNLLDDTIKVDGLSLDGESILSGINIGGLKKGESKRIEFNTKIMRRSESGIVENVSIGQYEYKISGEDRIRIGSSISNENNIIVQVANITINKSVDIEEISLGDEVKYYIEVANNGTLEAKNIVVREGISNSYDLVNDEFTIDGQVINNINLSKGILIGDLNVGEKIFLTYKVKYTSASNCKKIANITTVNFNYKKTAGLILKATEVLKQLEVSTTISNFKYVSIGDKIFRDKNKPQIGEVNNVGIDIDILEYHLVKTVEGKSNGGQILTGYKIVIQGIIKEIAEYTAEQFDQSVYTVCSNIPFSAFIVLPSNFKDGSKIRIDYKIEDISYKRRDGNCIYTNVCLLLIAKVQPYIMA